MSEPSSRPDGAVPAADATERSAEGPSPVAADAPRHHGSSAINLSGGAVLGAWSTSVLLHGGAMAIMVLIPFSFRAGQGEPPVGPKLSIVGDVDGASFGVPPPAVTPPSPSPMSGEPPPTLGSPGTKERVSAFRTFPPPSVSRPGDLGVIGLANGRGALPAAGAAGPSVSGIGTGMGELRGGGGSGDGPGIGGSGSSEFFGVGRSAKGIQKLVYVVDRSASMIDTFQYVQKEMKRSISALRRSQQFHVIFFNSGPILENPPQRLVHAVASHKQQFFEFLSEVEPRGGTKPEAALARALALKPDLIYLLSDGIDFDPQLIDRLNEWNRDRRVRIYTIAYLDPGGRQILERIAREHNGESTFVSEHNLP